MVQAEEKKTHYAVCVLNPDGGSGVSGIAKLTQVEGEQVEINVEIKGLTPGLHGFHIHQFGKYFPTFKLTNFPQVNHANNDLFHYR